MNTEGNTYIFYAGQLHSSFPTGSEGLRGYRLARLGAEIYNGAYLFAPNKKWYRCDLTPVLDEDVPKELKMLVLLMDL